MKFIVCVLLMTIGLSCAANIIIDNGQPGCKLEKELEVVNFRNFWDPTAYWKCVELSKPATSAKCPDGEGWVDSVKKCVDWDSWEWEELVAPLSKP